jgi:pyruvate dehydrogenase E2 component (dihydrolipoamide acetyltransferase)
MAFLGRNIQLGPALKISGWRKSAIGTWTTAMDPSMYGTLHLNVEKAQTYIDKIKRESGQRITFSHFMGKVVAETFKRHPDINCILRMGRLYPRKNIDIFFQVAADDEGKDLTGMTVRNADQKTIPAIAREMEERVEKIRAQKDQTFTRMKDSMRFLPGFVASWVIGLTGLFMYGMNIWCSLFGLPKDPFGSAMITNIGSLGLEEAFAPLVPFSRIPIVIALGATRDEAVVKDGKIGIARMIKICVTMDHRLIDGVHAAHMAKTVQKIFADPEGELP